MFEFSGYILLPGGTRAPIKYAVIDAAASGDNTLVAAVTGKKIRVVSLWYIASSTVTAIFQSGASGTALTGGAQHIAQTGIVLPRNPDGWFQTGSGVLLNLNLSAAVSVDGSLNYIEV